MESGAICFYYSTHFKIWGTVRSATVSLDLFDVMKAASGPRDPELSAGIGQGHDCQKRTTLPDNCPGDASRPGQGLLFSKAGAVTNRQQYQD